MRSSGLPARPLLPNVPPLPLPSSPLGGIGGNRVYYGEIREEPMEERLDARLMELPPAALHELAGRISGIDEFRGWWQGRGHACPSVFTRLQERTIEVSSDISARNASRASFSPPRNPPWGQRRVGGTGSGVSASRAGHADLLRSVFRGYRDMEFGQDLILRFHSQLFRYSAAHRAHRGRYKEVPDRSPAYVRGGMESPALRPTEPHLVPREMEILVHWTTARIGSPAFHPLLVIASFLLEFLAIRPFADGPRRSGTPRTRTSWGGFGPSSTCCRRTPGNFAPSWKGVPAKTIFRETSRPSFPFSTGTGR